MKVKELIDKLKELDQEKEIWVLYDGFIFIEPNVELGNIEDYDDVDEIDPDEREFYFIDAN